MTDGLDHTCHSLAHSHYRDNLKSSIDVILECDGNQKRSIETADPFTETTNKLINKNNQKKLNRTKRE